VISQLLLVGQVLVVVLVYVFVWRVVRTARRDILAPGGQMLASGGAVVSQDSTIIPAADAAAARRAAGLAEPRVVVTSSETLREGVPYGLGSGISIGRAADNDIVIDDGFVSSHHARLVPPATLVDLDSTNGTLVNGRALQGRVRLRNGDQFQFGATVFRYESGESR
jgi:hypothetical protein